MVDAGEAGSGRENDGAGSANAGVVVAGVGAAGAGAAGVGAVGAAGGAGAGASAGSGGGGKGRREQLLDAAARCFSRGGFHGTTVAEISLEAECSPGLLYRYFAGKEALVAALVEREAERTVAALSSVRGSANLAEDLDVERSITGWDDARTAALHIQIIAEASRGSAISEPVRNHFHDVTAALAETLKVGQQAGVVDAGLDPGETARILVAMVSGLTLMRAVDDDPARPTPAATAKQLLKRMLDPKENQ